MTSSPSASPTIDAVVIGRNESRHLAQSLPPVAAQVRRLVFVDSGSEDDSVEVAQKAGADVVQLDMSLPFTAARARNAGLAALEDDAPDFVMLMDGDCQLDPHWIATASAFLIQNSDVVVVCGRRREISPDASVYNWLCDREWDTPIGKTRACGGDALARYDALRATGYYRAALIAGEEPEMCVRLRAAGGVIWRLDAEMTLHDARMNHFVQWWRRSVRAGYAFAQGADLHGAPPEKHWVAETRRCLIWGAAIPALILLSTCVNPMLLGLSVIYPLQWARLRARLAKSQQRTRPSTEAFYLLLGKVAEAQGAISFYWDRLRGTNRSIVEYK